MSVGVRVSVMVGLMMPALVLSACGEGADGGVEDGGVDASGDALVPPGPGFEAPRLTPCPDGWREVTDAVGIVLCDPFPEGGVEDCAADELHLPGGDGCERLGSACPADGFPEDLPADEMLLFVSASSAAGNGTREFPYPTIVEAMDAAVFGTVVAVGVGDYDEVVYPTTDASIVGACVSGTRLTSSDRSARGAVQVVVRGARIANLQIVDSVSIGVYVGTDASVQVEDALIVGATKGGISSFGGTVHARRVAVRDVREAEGLSTAVDVYLQGSAQLSRVALSGGLNGVTAFGARAIVSDSTLRRIGGTGIAIIGALDDAEVTIERSYLGEIATAAVYSIGSAPQTSRVQVSDSSIADAMGNEEGQAGNGVVADLQSEVTLSRVSVLRAREIGVFINGGTATAEDLLVRDVQAQRCADSTCMDEPAGHGIGVYRGATLSVARFQVRSSALCGVHVALDGSLDLTRGDVSGNEIGACVQVPGYDLARLTDAVTYRDNTLGLESTSLPVPMPRGAL